MASMRQRLLLAAGWLVAVVGSGVVASGAVAVAGGQVLDRPLRPLTAAEVAALPVAVVQPVPNEPLASGGSASTSGDTTTGSDSGATDRSSEESAGPGGAPNLPTVPRSVDVVITTLTPVEPNTDRYVPQSAIVFVDGGAASILSSEEGLNVLWARPSAGYVMGLRFEAADALILSFTGATTRFSITVASIDGEMTVETAEEASL